MLLIPPRLYLRWTDRAPKCGLKPCSSRAPRSRGTVQSHCSEPHLPRLNSCSALHRGFSFRDRHSRRWIKSGSPVHRLSRTAAVQVEDPGFEPGGSEDPPLGRFGPTFWRYEFAPVPSAESTTISDRVLLTISFSSACSSAGTLNLSSVC